MQTTMTAEEFKKRLDAGQVPFIFDLRNSDEFKAWRIEGRTGIETLNVPQEEFVGEEERHLQEFPKDRLIVTFCAHGAAAQYSADVLRQHGFNAIALEGGMDLWSEYYEHRQAVTNPAVHQIYRVAKGCIAYLVTADDSAVVIDAPRHTRAVLDLAEKLKVKIVHVLDTHLHADHISGGREIAGQTGAAYHVNPLDAKGATYPYTPLTDGGRISFGTSTIEAVHSPGHTPGSTSFLLDGKILFTGDIIMKESIGRPDLGGMSEQWATDLHDTLFKRFAQFGDDLVVLPAHSTGIHEQDADGLVKLTLGRARAGSDLYQLPNLPDFLARIRTSLPENPDRYREIRKANLGIIEPDEPQRKELEIGKNLCGMQKKA
jgi:glyoxylase-like metal-dependent hydrolase (beta-lactamase superfamily II)/rhodanese-related sulfurtransferase